MADLDKQIEALERDIKRRERLIAYIGRMPLGDSRSEVEKEIEQEQGELRVMREVLGTMRRVRVMAPYLAEPE